MKIQSKSKGTAALMLVLWTSLALAGLLFDMTSAYSLRLIAVKTEQHRRSARMAALLCRDILLVELSENSRFVPTKDREYKNISCKYVYFNSNKLEAKHVERTEKMEDHIGKLEKEIDDLKKTK